MDKINLMVSASKKGKGGIATVVNVYEKEGFFERWNIHYIATAGSTSKLIKLTLFLISLGKLIKLISFKHVGLIHINMSSRGSYFRKSLILRFAKFFSVKAVVHLHSGEFDKFYNKECSERKKQHIRATFNMADKVIVLSSHWLEWVNTIVKDKTKTCIVYNAVKEIDLPNKQLNQSIILFLGQLVQGKGVEDLINAFAKIAEKFPEVELHLGGEGDLVKYQAQAKALGIDEKVAFLGWVTGNKKNQCLANATIYCLPSYYEGFPMGILEAMAAEIAVVSSNVGGIPDAIDNGKEGILIEPGDVDALAVALSTMLEDNDLRTKYVNAAKSKFLRNFSPSIIIPQLNSIYKELLEQKQ